MNSTTPTTHKTSAGEVVVVQGSWKVIDLVKSFHGRYEVYGTLWLDGQHVGPVRVREYRDQYHGVGYDRLDPVRWWIPCADGGIKSAGPKALELVTDHHPTVVALLRSGILSGWYPDRNKPGTHCRFRFKPEHLRVIARIAGAKPAPGKRGAAGGDAHMDRRYMDLMDRVAASIDARPLHRLARR